MCNGARDPRRLSRKFDRARMLRVLLDGWPRARGLDAHDENGSPIERADQPIEEFLCTSARTSSVCRGNRARGR